MTSRAIQTNGIGNVCTSHLNLTVDILPELTTAAGLAAHYADTRHRLNNGPAPKMKPRPKVFTPFQSWPPRNAPEPLPVIRIKDIEPKFVAKDPHGPPRPRRGRDFIFIDAWTSRDARSSRKDIVAAVADKHGITFTELIGPQRSRAIVMARHEVCWRLKKETTLSLPQIGARLGNRDHTTILHGVRQHQARIDAGQA